MPQYRSDSLAKIDLPGWRWMTFLDEIKQHFACFNPKPYPIPFQFLQKEDYFGPKKKLQIAKTLTWAFSSKKIRQARAACVHAGENISVLNFVVSPFHTYDLPFFGADFVSLPSGHLLALDFQPALKNDDLHTKDVWSRLIPIYKKWKILLPEGGPIPSDAEPFFSPGFLWSRIPLGKEGDEFINELLKPAFLEYLLLYIDLLNEARVIEERRAAKILEGQRCYMNYRAKKDPARSMLSSFYGTDWTEKYINRVLFDLK